MRAGLIPLCPARIIMMKGENQWYKEQVERDRELQDEEQVWVVVEQEVEEAEWAAEDQGLAVNVYALSAGHGYHTSRVCHVLNRNVLSAQPQWSGLDEVI